MARRSITVVLAILAVVRAAAAQAGGGDFEELSRRAAAAVDAHPEQAVALYRQALAKRPGWAEGWLYMGASLFQLGRFGEARDALRKGAALEPRKGTPWAFLGMAEYEAGEYRQALSDIVKGEAIGVADKPEFVAAVRYRAALACLRFSDYAQALDQLRPLARAGNDSTEVIEALGLAALNLGYLPSNLPEAKRPLVELAGRAAAAYVAERAEESRPLFEQLVAQFPNEPGVHYMRGVFLKDQDADAAEEEFRKELGIAPSHILARVQWALLLVQRGDSERAVKLAQEAVGLAPGNAVCQSTLGRALLSAGQIGPAIAALETAVKLAPNASRSHFYLEQAYRRAGRDADARKQKTEFNRLRAEQEPVTVAKPGSPSGQAR